MRSEPVDPADARGAGDASDSDDAPLRRPVLPPPLPLAHGELGAEDALELRALKEQIRSQSGLFCEGYKEKCLRRRLAVRMRARGVQRYGDYARLLESDAEECGRLLDTVTINVSKFFRNPEVWDAIRELVLPDIFAGSGPVRFWSAGCATGEEPYTMAMLVRGWLEDRGRAAELDRVDIEATDIDRLALDKARNAAYPALALAETADADRDRWFEPGGPPYRVRDEVRSMIRFTAGDLIREPARENLDVVICRNVFIYFERELQERLLSRFADSLRPGGWLILGKVETLLGPVTSRLDSVRQRERVYRKR